MVCWNCGENGHIAQACRNRPQNIRETPVPQWHSEGRHLEAPDNIVTLHTLSVTCGVSFCIVVSINTIPVECLVDTGAAISHLHGNVWTKIVSHNCYRTHIGQMIVGVNGNKLLTIGYSQIPILVKGKQFNGKFVVTNNIKVDAILGLDFFKENHCMIETTYHFPPKVFSLPLDDSPRDDDTRTI